MARSNTTTVTYGVNYNGDDEEFDYHTGIEAAWFEKCGGTFKPETGAGGLEIWIPVST